MDRHRSAGEIDGTLAEVYQRIGGRSGAIAYILRCQSLHPEALRDHYALYRTIMFDRPGAPSPHSGPRSRRRGRRSAP